MESKTLLESILGPKPTSAAQTTAQLIGGALGGLGLYGAIKGAKGISYGKATLGGPDVDAVAASLGKRGEEAQASLQTDLAGYQAGAEAAAERGLATRGLTDPRLVKEAKSQVGRGLSGAYASARAALTGAKLRASQGLSNALSNYYMDLAAKQYQNMMANYAAKMGIWGALGGLGGSLLAAPSVTKDKPKVDPKYQDYVYDPSAKQFSMKGVKFVEPGEASVPAPVMLNPSYVRRK